MAWEEGTGPTAGGTAEEADTGEFSFADAKKGERKLGAESMRRGLFEIFSNNSKEEGGGGWGRDGSEVVCAVGLQAVMARDMRWAV